MIVSDLMTVEEASAYTRTPTGTLANWRSEGRGPRYARIGKRVFYRKVDLDRWLDSQFIRRRSA